MNSALKTLCESDAQVLDWESLELYWQEKFKQASLSDQFPNYLIYPSTIESLSKLVKYASDRHWGIVPCGNGSKFNWGGLLKDVRLVISTSYLNRIIEYAVDDLTITVEAGVKLADLQNTLNQKGQFLPIDPAYPESATIGGIIATADTGSWRQRYGGVRDMLLGLSFVRADGEIAKAGGRVVKNVAGYDLMKLFTGSYGSLGIISQATFRVYPLPLASRTVVLSGDKTGIASAAQNLLASTLTPTAFDLLSASLVHLLGIGRGMGLIVRFQSIEESVEEQSAKISSIGEQFGLQFSVYQDTDEQELWQRLSQTISVPASAEAVTCIIGVLPSNAPKILTKLDMLTEEQGLGTIHASSGLGRCHLMGKNVVEQISELRSLAFEYRGFLTILEATPSLKQQIEPWGYTGNALGLMRQIKQQFDPNNILSPARFVGGI